MFPWCPLQQCLSSCANFDGLGYRTLPADSLVCGAVVSKGKGCVSVTLLP